MKVGIKEQVKAYIDAHPDCGMTFGEWEMVVSRIEYQRCLKEGKPRYDIHGKPDGEVSAKEAEDARLKVARIKAVLDARRDAREKNDVTAE